MKQGLAVVAYDCQAARVLRDCRVDGSYGFVGVATKEQLIRLRGTDELRLNLPFFGAKLTAGMQRDAVLDVALAVVGQQVASRPVISSSDLVGECADATHFVRAATVGAFVMRTGTHGRMDAAADVLALGASGSSSSSRDVLNRDGDPVACRSGDANSTQCRSLLRLELKALSATAEDPFVEYATQSTCPGGSVFEAGKCARPRNDTPHLCEYGDARDCKAQCDHGNAPSCTRLGLMHERGEGVAQDAQAAALAYDRACTGDDVPACARLGATLVARTDADRGLGLLRKACDAGWSVGCQGVIEHFSKHPPPAGTNLIPIVQRACDAGSADGCATLGEVHKQGLGIAKDAERAVYFFRRACTGGSSLGCTLLGQAYEQGDGVAKDAGRATELYSLGCTAKSSVACDAAARMSFAAQDAAKGVELLQRACDLGNAGSCFVLGLRYRQGMGVPADPVQAGALIKRACDGGQPIACQAK